MLLILSLLVGSLLVGRQIVDRAKIQRIIFEFDYYEKAFHQFYDTYRVVPGNLDYKTCIKHAEFSGCACSGTQQQIEACKGCSSCTYNYTVQQWCNKHSFVNVSTGNSKIMKCEYDMCLNSILQMKKAGYISQEAFPYNGHTYANQTTMFSSNAENRKGAPKAEGHNAITSFDSQGRVFLSGFRKVGDYEITDHKNGFAQRAWWILGSSNGYQKEFWNADFDANLNNYNVIIVGKASAAGSGLKAESSMISAKMTSQLDAKIDDGRPGTGKLVALKSYHALKPSATANEINNNCYDGDFVNVTKTIYSSSNDLKYGCNIIKVMEDVK